MTDRASTVLLAALDGVQAGRVVSVDTFRDLTDEAASLSGAEKAAALTSACRAGYLHAITMLLDDGMTLGTVQIRTRHEKGKGRWVMLYRRTDKEIPAHLCGRTP